LPTHRRSFVVAVLLAAACAASALAAAPADLTPAQLESIVREMSAWVEKVRGLKFKTPVSMEILDGKAARENFKAKIETGTLEQARHAQNAYVHLGLVPAGTDLIRNYLDQAEKDVLGYYDSHTKKLYLLSHVPADEVKSVVVHELTHALEDQHFDFQAIGKLANGDDDRGTAITALIEGSAMVVTINRMIWDTPRGVAALAGKPPQQKELKRSATLKAAPSFVQQTVMLPYLLGIQFLLRGKPWMLADGMPNADIAAAYASPPRSTTQILHPEQYWWGQWRKRTPPPSLPDLSKALGAGWSKALEGSIGELGLAVLTGSKLDISSMQALLPNGWTHEAAEGTTGDVFHHYVKGEQQQQQQQQQKATVLLTRWETVRDADQFDRALRSRGSYFLRYGINVLVVAGDVNPETGLALANAAMQNLSYWPPQ
jgi:hypothetical protein